MNKKTPIEEAILSVTNLPRASIVAFQALWVDDECVPTSLNLEVVCRTERERLYKPHRGADIIFDTHQLSSFFIESSDVLTDVGRDSIRYIQDMGNHLATLYNVEFYFPSPDECDDNCPSWEKKAKYPTCSKCNKHIVRSYGNHDYLPKVMCRKCSLIANEKEKEIYKAWAWYGEIMINCPSTNEEVVLFRSEDKQISRLVQNWLKSTSNKGNFHQDPLMVIHFDNYLMSKYKLYLENQMEKLIAKTNFEYAKSDHLFEKIEYKGVIYPLTNQKKHHELYFYFSQFQKIDFEKNSLKLYMKNLNRQESQLLAYFFQPYNPEILFNKLSSYLNSHHTTKEKIFAQKMIDNGYFELKDNQVVFRDKLINWFGAFRKN